MSEICLGVDLGTTFSAVSYFKDGEAVIIPNQEGLRTTASVVAYVGDQILVGDAARRQQIMNPEKTIYSSKRFMGMKMDQATEAAKTVSYKVVSGNDGAAVFQVGDKQITPEEVAAQILIKLKKSAEAFFGHEVKKAVITCPAFYGSTERKCIETAAKISGLVCERILNEPTSAALQLSLLGKKADQVICVQDIGGATYDCTLIMSEGTDLISVISTAGDLIGGDDFDNRIVDYLAEEFKKENGIDLRKDRASLQRLRTEAEKAKKDLSSQVEVEINIPFITADQNGPKHLVMKLSKARFESLVVDLMDKAMECTKRALKDANMTVDQVDDVVVVGGSSRIPLFLEKTRKLFGKEPNQSSHPDEAISLGAAIQAGIMFGGKNDLLLLDVVSLSLGINTYPNVFTTLIPRNTRIPTSKTQVFSNAADMQPSVNVEIGQGERKFFTEVKSLGSFNLPIVQCKKGTAQVSVEFSVNASGIITVAATDLATKQMKDITIDAGGLSPEEIDRMIKDSEANAEADAKKLELVNKFNNLDALILNASSTLKEHKDTLSTKIDVPTLEEALKSAQEVLDTRNADALDKTVESLTNLVHKMAEAMYAKPTEDPTTPTKPPEEEIIDVSPGATK